MKYTKTLTLIFCIIMLALFFPSFQTDINAGNTTGSLGAIISWMPLFILLGVIISVFAYAYGAKK